MSAIHAYRLDEPTHVTEDNSDPVAPREPLAAHLHAVPRDPVAAHPAYLDQSTGRARVGQAFWLVTKRAFDVGLSLLLLIAVLPLFAVVALAIKLDSPGPVFHRVRRVGYRRRELMMLKFRKMHHDARGGPLTVGQDPRLTRVGAVLTRTRIDELPQLWDVLRGRMSLVGPRPEDPRFVMLHGDQYDGILSVRPGITGLAQLAYASEREILDDDDPVGDYLNRILPQKVILDTLYASRSRLLLDVNILRWTIVAVVLRRPVAVNRATGRLNLRRRSIPAPAPHLSAEPALQSSAAG